jgi:hypothetical protein
VALHLRCGDEAEPRGPRALQIRQVFHDPIPLGSGERHAIALALHAGDDRTDAVPGAEPNGAEARRFLVSAGRRRMTPNGPVAIGVAMR